MGRGVHEPDRTGVDVPEDVAADHLVRRTDVGARRAADAAQDVAHARVGVQLAPAVVDEHEVDLAVAIDTGDEARVGRDLLGRRAAGEEPELRGRIGERRHELLPARDDDERLREGAHEVST